MNVINERLIMMIILVTIDLILFFMLWIFNCGKDWMRLVVRYLYIFQLALLGDFAWRIHQAIVFFPCFTGILLMMKEDFK